METKKHIELLGLRAKDAVTGFEGVITSIDFDLYGCVQAAITPPVDDKGELKDGKWFDVTRLIVSDKVPVMALPDFSKGYVAQGKKGCADKPLPYNGT